MRGRGEEIDPRTLMHWARVEVRYSDLDIQGHVNNALYLTYFEQGRVSFFDALRRLAPRKTAAGDAAEHGAGLTPDDITFVIVEASCSYKRPIAGLASVHVGVGTARVRHAALEMVYAVCDRPGGEGTLHATGSTLVASVDLATGRPKALPAWTREALERMGAYGNAAGTSGPSA